LKYKLLVNLSQSLIIVIIYLIDTIFNILIVQFHTSSSNQICPTTGPFSRFSITLSLSLYLSLWAVSNILGSVTTPAALYFLFIPQVKELIDLLVELHLVPSPCGFLMRFIKNDMHRPSVHDKGEDIISHRLWDALPEVFTSLAVITVRSFRSSTDVIFQNNRCLEYVIVIGKCVHRRQHLVAWQRLTIR